MPSLTDVNTVNSIGTFCGVRQKRFLRALPDRNNPELRIVCRHSPDGNVAKSRRNRLFFYYPAPFFCVTVMQFICGRPDNQRTH